MLIGLLAMTIKRMLEMVRRAGASTLTAQPCLRTLRTFNLPEGPHIAPFIGSGAGTTIVEFHLKISTLFPSEYCYARLPQHGLSFTCTSSSVSSNRTSS